MIFEEQVSRKPNLYPWTEQAKQAMHKGFWTDKHFTFSSDIQQFKVSLSDQERQIIIRTLSAIGQIEVAVKSFWSKLGDNLPHPSLADLGIVMGNTEVIHNDAYERLLTLLGLDDVFEENLKLDWIQGRVKYLKKYTHKFYKDSKKDTDQQVKYTRNEETIHALVGMKIVNTIRHEYPDLFDQDLESKILEEAEQAFFAESKIIDWMVNGINEPNLSAPILKELIKQRINDSLEQIGFSKLFNIDKELIEKTTWFNEELLANNMADFFHSKPTEYSKDSHSFSEDELF